MLLKPRFVILLSLIIAGGAVSLWLFRTTPESLYQQAMMIKGSDPKQAQQLLLHGIALADAGFPQANLALCELLVGDGQCIEALGSFAGIANVNQCDPGALHQLARTAIDSHCVLLAKLSAEAAATRPGDHQADAMRIVAIALNAEQNWQAALHACDRWIEVDPISGEAWAMKGELFNKMLRPLPAVDAYRKALSLYPPKAQATLVIRRSLLALLLAIGELDEARVQLASISESDRESVELATAEAKLLHLEGDLAAARTLIDQVVLRCESDCWDALFLRGVIHFDLANYDLCITDLQKVIAIKPNHKEAHYKLGRALLSVGQNDLARQHLDISRQMTDAVIRSMSGDANPK